MKEKERRWFETLSGVIDGEIRGYADQRERAKKLLEKKTSLMTYLNKRKKDLEKALEKNEIPKELHNTVSNMTAEEIVSWYKENKDNGNRKQIEYVYNERVIQITEEKAKRMGEYRERIKPIRTAEKIVETIKDNNEVKEVIASIANTFDGVTAEYVTNVIGSQLVPGWTSYSITSLGPYLGEITVGRPKIPIEETVRKIPEEFLKNDERLKHEFYRLFDKQYKKDFFLEPEKILRKLKAKAANESNKINKELLEKLYCHYREILDFPFIRNAKSKILNPEYKGGRI